MKILTKIEIGLIAIAVLAIILKFIHVVDVNAPLIISLSLLAVLYFPVGFLTLKQDNSQLGINIITGFGLFEICFGICFKMQFWFGAFEMLQSGLWTLTIISVVVLLIFFFKQMRRDYYKSILIRVIPFLFFGYIFWNTSSVTLAKIYYRNDPVMIEKMTAWILDPSEENEEDLREYRNSRSKK